MRPWPRPGRGSPARWWPLPRSARPDSRAQPAGRTEAVATTLPRVPRVEDTAGLGGTVPAIEQLGECIRAAQQVMAYARHADGNVRSAKILLTGGGGAQALARYRGETAAGGHGGFAGRKFHAAVFETIREESPATAERLLVRLQQLNASWGLG